MIYTDTKSKNINEQINILYQFIPEVGFIDERRIITRELPLAAEGWFIIPRWQLLASTYEEALELILERGNFLNYFHGQLQEREIERGGLEKKLEIISKSKSQDSDILILPAQLGLLYKGYSSDEVRRSLKENEFQLGAFEISVILLTHKNRLNHYNDLGILCGGDMINPDPEEEIDHISIPCFSFRGRSIQIGLKWSVQSLPSYGSVTAFL